MMVKWDFDDNRFFLLSLCNHISEEDKRYGWKNFSVPFQFFDFKRWQNAKIWKDLLPSHFNLMFSFAMLECKIRTRIFSVKISFMGV
jgi:hypothetical protein